MVNSAEAGEMGGPFTREDPRQRGARTAVRVGLRRLVTLHAVRGGRGEDGAGCIGRGCRSGNVVSIRLRPRTDHRRVARSCFVRGWLLEGEGIVDEETP